MTDAANIEHWLILNRAPGVGAVKFHALLERFETPAGVLRAGPGAWAAAGLNPEAVRFLQNPDRALIESDLAWLRARENTVLTVHDNTYPVRLKNLNDAPPLLFVKGNASLLNDPQIAIVGTRKPTPGGEKTARRLAHKLASAGILVTSGMARGIDSFAHRGALEAGAPSLAVIGTGQDIIYPAKNKNLAQALVDHGVIVSEFPCGTQPLAANFPRRNRILSGLALGVLVVEAGTKSGSLISARLANEQGREVFAVPGSVYNPMSKGCHRLIREGATLVEDVGDVLAEIKSHAAEAEAPASAVETAAAAAQPGNGLDPSHLKLLNQMGYDPVTADDLAERTGMPVEEIASTLLMLELEDLVSNNGGLYCRIA